MLNGGPLGAIALNALFGSGAPDSHEIVPGSAFRWRVRVDVDGEDVSPRLTGQIQVDRERGAAGLSSFTLQMLPGPVLPMDWVGREVTVEYFSTAQGVTTQKRRYSGRIVTTEWNPISRLLACQCGDQLQQRIESMSVAEVDALIPAFWSPDVFEAPDGRSRWDYAQERLGTIQSSLDSSADGALRLTTWYAGTEQHVFGAGTTVFNSIKLAYADLTSLTNKVEIETSYRFSRLHQLNQGFHWTHPDTFGLGGTQGFCLWRQDSTDLPDIAMMKESASGGGFSIVRTPGYTKVPGSGADICGNGQPWVNSFPDLLLGFSFVGARRWTQAVTEKYTLTVQADASISQAGEVTSRDSLSIEYTHDVVDAWEGTAFGVDAPRPATNEGPVGIREQNGVAVIGPVSDGGLSGHADVRDENARLAALRCVLNQAKTSVVVAHSGTTISWDVPTSMVLNIDLGDTLRISDQGINARARCSRVLDTFDLASGSAVTTLAITVMRGGGAVDDVLDPPAPSIEPQPDDPDTPASTSLPTQIGGKPASPAYDESLEGFAGNYDNADPTLEQFPRRLQITATEIGADLRDEKVVELATVYRVSIPNDLLEL